jgi:hypothetical protein
MAACAKDNFSTFIKQIIRKSLQFNNCYKKMRKQA